MEILPSLLSCLDKGVKRYRHHLQIKEDTIKLVYLIIITEIFAVTGKEILNIKFVYMETRQVLAYQVFQWLTIDNLTLSSPLAILFECEQTFYIILFELTTHAVNTEEKLNPVRTFILYIDDISKDKGPELMDLLDTSLNYIEGCHAAAAWSLKLEYTEFKALKEVTWTSNNRYIYM